MTAIVKLTEQEAQWIGEAPDEETMADGMKRRGRGRRSPSGDRGGRDARSSGGKRPERRDRASGQRPPRDADAGRNAEAKAPESPPRQQTQERARPRRSEEQRDGPREDRREGRRQGGHGERDAPRQTQQPSRVRHDAAPQKAVEASRKHEPREREPVPFGLDENVPAFLRRPVRIAGR
jgi:hypothetical protein